MPEVELRRLKRTDLFKSGKLIEWDVVGLTAILDGEIAGYAGVQKFGLHHWVFFDLFDQRVARPFFLHRLVKQVLVGFDKGGIERVYSFCDHARAQRWHGVLGFREVTDDDRDDEIRMCEAINKRGAWVR